MSQPSVHPLIGGPLVKPIIYPDSDGERMAENTKQFEWIVTIQGGFSVLYRDDPHVFVAGDLLWYPVEGDNKTRCAPDIMLALGRPKGDRGSYKQWEEGGLAPQVVFEVLSPGNRPTEMERRRGFYERFGVQEYYEYDPDFGDLQGYLRSGEKLVPIPNMRGWTSPLTEVRFDLNEGILVLTGPDGRAFQTFHQICAARDVADRRADAESRRADEESRRAVAECRRADEAEIRMRELEERLRSLGQQP